METGGVVSLQDQLADLYADKRGDRVKVARLLLGSELHAEDIVQEAFARLAQRADLPESAGGYLRTVVVNLCRDNHRRRRRGANVVFPPALPVVNPGIDQMWKALEVLPFEQRAALVLRY
jgi:DNA-directed RNA polymerase specialized sigma24 family protein